MADRGRRVRRQRKFRAKKIYAQAMGEAKTRPVDAAERVRLGKRRRRRTQLAIGVLVLAAVIGVQHFVAHLASLKFTTAQDLLIGYPTAAVLAIAGLMALPRK